MTNTREQKPLVLFVDDQPDQLQLLALAVRTYKPCFDAAFADNVECALCLIRERHPAAVILDINLAGETGIKIAEHLHTYYPRIAKAVLTAYDRSVTHQNAEEFGMDVWAKPMTPQEVIDRVEALLAGREPAAGSAVGASVPPVVRTVAVALGVMGGAQLYRLY